MAPMFQKVSKVFKVQLYTKPKEAKTDSPSLRCVKPALSALVWCWNYLQVTRELRGWRGLRISQSDN